MSKPSLALPAWTRARLRHLRHICIHSIKIEVVQSDANFKDVMIKTLPLLWNPFISSLLAQATTKSMTITQLKLTLSKEHQCYDLSFLFLHCSSNDSLSYWTNFSPSFAETLHLNSASIALRRAWLCFSLISSHGRHFPSCVTSYTAFSPSITWTTFPLISVLAFLLRTLLGPCAGSPHIYMTTSPVFSP